LNETKEEQKIMNMDNKNDNKVHSYNDINNENYEIRSYNKKYEDDEKIEF